MVMSAIAVVFSLLINRRAQAVAAVAMALLASVLLGGDITEAGRCIPPGGPRHP